MEQNVKRVVDTTFEGAEKVKAQAADVLEEAARKLREMSITAKGEELKAVLDDAGEKIERLRAEAGHKVEPVEGFIKEHPLMSIVIAAGAGALAGALLARRD